MKKVFMAILLVLCLLTLSSCKQKSRMATQNEAAILAAIQSHGSNYTIVREGFDRYGDSGRNPDFMVVSQNGFEYTVYAENGIVTEDTYVKSEAGFLFVSQFEKDAASLLKGHSYDVSGILETDGIMRVHFYIYNCDIFNPENEPWIYDLYSQLYDDHKDIDFSFTANLYRGPDKGEDHNNRQDVRFISVQHRIGNEKYDQDTFFSMIN